MADFSKILGLGVVLNFKDELSAKVGTAAAKLAVLEESAGRSAVGVERLSAAFKLGGIAMAAGGGILASLGVMIKTADDFDDVMVNVQRTTGFSNEQISQLSKELMTLSTKLPVSAQELAKITVTAGKLGAGLEGGIEGVKSFAYNSLRMAKVSGLSAESSAESFGRLSKVFGLNIKDSEKMGSVILKMSSITSASAQDIVDSSLRFGALGSAMGITLDQAAAFSATMRDAGIMADLGGTAMVRILTAMSEKTENFASVMGLSSAQLKELFSKSPAKALQLFFAAFGDMKKEQIIEKMASLGLESTRVGTIVFGLSKQTESLSKNLYAASDAFRDSKFMGESYEKMTQGLDSQLTILWGSIKSLWIIIGTTLIPVVVSMVSVGIKFFELLIKIPRPILAGIAVFSALTGTLLFLGGTIVTLVATLGFLKIGLAYSAIACEWFTIAQYGGLKALSLSLARFTLLNTQLLLMRTRIFLVATATRLWTVAQWLLNTALLSNPIGLTIVGVAALVGAIIFLLNKFGLLNSVIKTVWSKFSLFKDLVIKVGGAVIKYLFAPQELVIGAFVKLIGFMGLWDKMSVKTKNTILSLKEPFSVLKIITTYIATYITETFKSFGNSLSVVFAWITDSIKKLPDMFNSMFSTVVNVLKTFGKWVYILVALPVFAVIGAIIKFIKWTNIMAVSIKVLGEIFKTIKQSTDVLVNILMVSLTKAYKVMESLFSWLIKSASPTFETFVSGIEFMFNKVVSVMKTIGGFLYSYGIEPWIYIGETIINVFKGVISYASSFFESIKNLILEPIKFIWNTLIGLTKNVPSSILPKMLQNLEPLGDGAVVVKPTPAIVGDKGPEAILPLNSSLFKQSIEKPMQNKMKDMVNESLKIVKFMVTIPVEIDGHEIARIVREFQEEDSIRSFVAPVRLQG